VAGRSLKLLLFGLLTDRSCQKSAKTNHSMVMGRYPQTF